MVQYCSSGFRPWPTPSTTLPRPASQDAERAQHKCDQDQEERFGDHQHRRHPRHHVAELAPVHENHDGRIRRQQPRPQQQRAFLSAPPGRELVDRLHGRIGVGRHIGQPEIAREEGIDEQAGRHGEQQPDRIDRALAADGEEGVFLKPAGHRRNDGVHGKAEGEQNRESADIFHCELVQSSWQPGRRAYMDGARAESSFWPGSWQAWLPSSFGASSFGAWLRTWTRISLALCWHERRRPDLIFRRREPARCP